VVPGTTGRERLDKRRLLNLSRTFKKDDRGIAKRGVDGSKGIPCVHAAGLAWSG
jgi:hypothetical protein